MSLFTTTCGALPHRALLPTPSAVSYGSNQGGGMGRVGPVRHSLDAMARKGLISSAAASPVRTSRSQEKAQALKALARDYGASSPELLGKFDHDTPLLRTSQLCLDGDYSEYSGTYGRSGMTRNGIVFLLAPLVRLTDATECGLLPTVTVGDSKSACNQTATRGRDWKDGSAEACKNISDNALLGRVIHRYPTPRATDGEKMTGGTGRTDSLPAMMRHSTEQSGSLNPTWVEWLMGFPLNWTSLEK